MAKHYKNSPLWHPKLWLTWIVVFFLYALSFFPMRAKQFMGKHLGKIAYRLFRSRRHVAEINIAKCFPEFSKEQQQKLVEDIFISCGRGFFESLHAWWQDCDYYRQNLKLTGVEHLRRAQASGKGILLLGGHFTTFDLIVPLMAPILLKPGYVYRPNDNPVVDRMIQKGRTKKQWDIRAFTKRELKPMIEYLKIGGEVWYASDQDFGKRTELFVPFFAIQAGCITTSSWIVKESSAHAIFIALLRHANGQYEVKFSPILENFGENPEADARQWNQCLEALIREHPDQYLWLHKRFKTRPPGEEKFY